MYVCKLVIVFAGLNPKAFMEMTEGKKRCLPLLGFVLAKSVEGFTLTTILGSSSFWGKIPKQAGLTGLGCVLTFRCATSELSAVAAGCFYIRLISAMWCLFSNGCVFCTQQCLLLCSSYFFRRCFMSLMEKCVCVCASLLTPSASQLGKYNQDCCALNNILAVWLHMHMLHPKLHMVIAVMYVTSKIANCSVSIVSYIAILTCSQVHAG